MKRFLVLVLAIIIIFSFTACTERKNYDVDGRFVNLNIGYQIDEGRYIVIEDTDTHILYLASDYKYDLCVFMDENGNPYTKEKFMKKYEK